MDEVKTYQDGIEYEQERILKIIDDEIAFSQRHLKDEKDISRINRLNSWIHQANEIKRRIKGDEQ